MGVRFDASGESYSRTLSLGSRSSWSVTGWLKVSVDRNARQTAWYVGNGSATFYLTTDSDGTTLALRKFGTLTTLVPLTVDTWYFVGVSAGSSSSTVKIRQQGAGSFTTLTPSVGVSSVDFQSLQLGASHNSGEWLNGCLADVKIWTFSLNATQLEAEYAQAAPVNTFNLYAYYRFEGPSTTDDSGNFRNLSGGAGTVEESDPFQVDETVSGTVDGALPAITGQGQGTVTAAGQLDVTLPALDGTTTGTLTVTGQVDGVLPALTGDLDGTTSAPGVLDATLPALTGELQGTLTGGFLVADLPALEGTATGHLLISGQADSPLPALASDLTGVVEIPHNDVTLTAGAPQRGWSARGPVTDWAAEPAAETWSARGPVTAWAAGPPQRAWAARTPAT